MMENTTGMLYMIFFCQLLIMTKKSWWALKKVVMEKGIHAIMDSWIKTAVRMEDSRFDLFELKLDVQMCIRAQLTFIFHSYRQSN